MTCTAINIIIKQCWEKSEVAVAYLKKNMSPVLVPFLSFFVVQTCKTSLASLNFKKITNKSISKEGIFGGCVVAVLAFPPHCDVVFLDFLAVLQ